MTDQPIVPEIDTEETSKTNQQFKAFDYGTEKSDAELTPELFEEFKNEVFAKQENIAALYKEIGQTPFYNYSRSHIRENRNKVIKSRKAESIVVIKDEVKRVLGSKIADSVARQLKSNDSIATVQHHAPLGHPDTLNATIAGALPYFGSGAPEHQNVLVFACAGVSFNNAKFPKGHLFHNVADNKLLTNQFTFFGHTVDARPVMHHHAYDYEDIISIKNSLQQLKREGSLSEEIYAGLVKWIEAIYGDPHPLSSGDYVDQVTITNYWLFKKLFENYNRQVPNLVFISQEKIALQLLLAYHLDTQTAINKMMFDPKVLDLIEQKYEGISGAFSKKENLGTFLFWGLPKHGKYRVQLWRNGNFLEDKEGSFKIELTPESIKKAILNNELIPSVMLSFSLLACYYGYFLGGGHLQTEYLTQMKRAYSEIMEEIGESESLAAVEGLITNNFIIPRPTLLYLKSGDKRVPVTAMDMMLYGDKGQNWQVIIEASKRVTMDRIIDRVLPGLYRDSEGFDINSKFAKITERDIEVYDSLDKNIPEIISLA